MMVGETDMIDDTQAPNTQSASTSSGASTKQSALATSGDSTASGVPTTSSAPNKEGDKFAQDAHLGCKPSDNTHKSSEPDAVAYTIHINRAVCTGCGLCEAFCPTEVYEMDGGEPRVVRAQDCWGCETCVGQCPVNALRVEASRATAAEVANYPIAPPLDEATRAQYKEWSDTLRHILGLRWHPVAITLVKANEPYPPVPIPHERLRYCQALMAARRGVSLLMPANRHACPDGTSILGLTPVPEKLSSGEIYILFHKLDTQEAAARMVNERPMLPPRSIGATCVCPLDNAQAKADVVSIVGNPEQMMWLSMATSYYTGHRHDFHASGYNAQCVEVTLLPYTSKKINISFGCYGCRASSDVEDSMMMMGIPIELMPDIVRGVRELGKKVIPQERDKIYLPPQKANQ